ncbi:hypothetical protein [Halostagnicola kamekurae]|uniref:Uncharacterized protein n=1 Tax=Halostagnicola kamekurae TaxID=619731 RepID=A0A1I6RG71_9EURY|nr:hypothetical protein [Halostagnicola kamekurae]SFS63666.1 hypothetical protein SAMN04488556_1770 [Halostagnicola kamekurae]
MNPSDADEDKEKLPGKCDSCGAVFTVWVLADGSIRPVSPENSCACEEGILRTVDKSDIFDNNE